MLGLNFSIKEEQRETEYHTNLIVTLRRWHVCVKEDYEDMYRCCM